MRDCWFSQTAERRNEMNVRKASDSRSDSRIKSAAWRGVAVRTGERPRPLARRADGDGATRREEAWRAGSERLA